MNDEPSTPFYGLVPSTPRTLRAALPGYDPDHGPVRVAPPPVGLNEAIFGIPVEFVVEDEAGTVVTITVRVGGACGFDLWDAIEFATQAFVV